MTQGTLFLAGFGFTARAIAERFTKDGWRVLASTRSGETGRTIEALGYHPVVADPGEVDGALKIHEAVKASEVIVSSIPPREQGDVLADLLGAMQLGDKWLGYLSTTGVYGDRQGGWAFEWQAATPAQPRSVARFKAEEKWLALGARIFRLSGIYGPGRSALDRVRNNAIVFDKPGQVFSRIHCQDIAAAIMHGVNTPQATGIFNLADDRPCTQVEIMRGAAELLGLPQPDIRPFDAARMTPMQASFFNECRRVSNARAKAVLGWRPIYPSWREGLAAIFAAEQANQTPV